MDFIKEILPKRFMLSERKLSDNKVSYDIHVDVGEYQIHDKLFEKYNFEPSGYGWEELIKVLVPKSGSDFIKRIRFDCSGDEFFAITNSELDQVKLANYFISLCDDTEKLERTLKIISEKSA